MRSDALRLRLDKPAGSFQTDPMQQNATSEADLREALATMDPAVALAACRRVLTADPHRADAYRVAARAYRALGEADEAERMEFAAIEASVHDPQLREAAAALAANALHVAEPILRTRLKETPEDVAAIRMLAELAGRIGRNRDAEALLRRALELAPAFHAARSNLALVLHRQNRTAEALDELAKLSAIDPDNPGHANLKAAALGRIGEFEEALALYEMLLKRGGGHPKVWMSYGHTLKTVGRQEESIEAYRQAVALQPALGEVWWSLANLKTVRFSDADVAAMEAALIGGGLAIEDRLHLEFALGKAFEDRSEPARSFGHYASGNALRRAQLRYDPDEVSRQVDRAIRTFTPEFFASRGGYGCDAPDPVFILGMPRAGSTLIEQILSSHSQVEGTMELPDIPALANQLQEGGASYPDALCALAEDEARRLGQSYLDRTHVQRKEGKPSFIDKLPNNWLHIGLIHLILPNAKIIDARRNPLDCCFSNFKQHFARGQGFSYGLEDVARYYVDYVRLMAHFDAVLPGRVHRVIHERLLDDPESEISALLQALGLPFEAACLSFHQNRRAVRTASSEQVRRPINREGVGQWLPYEPWLGPLKSALGQILTEYPEVPAPVTAMQQYPSK
jgi:tetratricopeptide (TPR) repeat protein